MNTRLIIYALAVGLAWALVGCNSQQPKIAPSQTAQLPSPTPQISTSVPTAISPKSTRPAGREDDESSEYLPRSTSTPTPIPPIPALAGLMYTIDSSQWLVAQDGSSVRIVDDRCTTVSPDRTMAVVHHCHSNISPYLLDLRTGITTTLARLDLHTADGFIWSPDSRRLLFTMQGDIWVKDISTGAVHNLSNTPDRNEESPHIWAAQPDMVIFQSWPADKMQDGEAGGALTVMKTDGTGYEVLHPDNLYGDGVPSPDGQHIAFVLYQEAPIWLYDKGSGANPFPFKKYGLTGVSSNISIPVWSPDGRRVALWGTFQRNAEETTTGLGIFDLANSQVTILDNIAPIPLGQPYNDPKWSPSGNWLTVFTAEQETSQRGIWLVNTKNWGMQLLMPVDDDWCSQAWAPDEQRLALNCSRAGVKPGIWIIDPRALKQTLVDLPLDAEITGWIKP